jgi:hypothetical protein
MKDKLCPMKFAKADGDGWVECEDGTAAKALCVGEKCAWWVSNYGDDGQCAMAEIADSQYNVIAMAQRKELY